MLDEALEELPSLLVSALLLSQPSLCDSLGHYHHIQWHDVLVPPMAEDATTKHWALVWTAFCKDMDLLEPFQFNYSVKIIMESKCGKGEAGTRKVMNVAANPAKK